MKGASCLSKGSSCSCQGPSPAREHSHRSWGVHNSVQADEGNLYNYHWTTCPISKETGWFSWPLEPESTDLLTFYMALDATSNPLIQRTSSISSILFTLPEVNLKELRLHTSQTAGKQRWLRQSSLWLAGISWSFYLWTFAACEHRILELHKGLAWKGP